MGNAKPPANISVPVELFGGLYTETASESLPLGASPLVINCDFILAGVFQRPGKQNQFYFQNFFSEKITNFAHSIPGPFDPNEVPWSSPTNAQLDIPGTYASVILNTPVVTVPGLGPLQGFASGASGNLPGSTGMSTAPFTPASAEAWAFATDCILGGTGISATPGGGFAQFGGTALSEAWGKLIAGMTPTAAAGTLSGATVWAMIMAMFTMLGGGSPTIVQSLGSASGSVSPGTTFGGNHTVTAGNTIIGVVLSTLKSGRLGPNAISDDGGNSYTGADIGAGDGGDFTSLCMSVDVAQNVNAGTPTFTVNVIGINSVQFACAFEVQAGVQGSASLNISQILQCINFAQNIQNTVEVLGFAVEISGLQSTHAGDAILTVSLANQAGTTFSGQLPLSQGTLVLGGGLSDWGLNTLTPAMFNDPNFGFNIVASALDGTPVTFDISAVKLKVFLTPNPPPDMNYIKTFKETGGEVLTLVLGSDGVFYQEDAINNPGVLNAVYSQIEPESFAFSCTFDDREFIAISDLKIGTDMPYSYTPPNFDRLSQVGPGAPPSSSSTSGGSNILSITQPPAQSDPEAPGQLSTVLWSAGPGTTSAGNVLTVYYGRDFPPGPLHALDPNLVVGSGVTLAGLDVSGPNNNWNGQTVDGNYIIQSVGEGIPPGAQYGRWFFTVQMPSTQSIKNGKGEGQGPLGTYQVTTATLTTAGQIPNLEVGNTLQIAGTGGAPPAGYDGSFPVTGTPNASQLQITSTALNGNTATYGFNLITGVNPVVGQIVTVSGTLNGNGIFNVSNAAISATSPGSFSVSLFGADVSSAVENGAGIIFGTIFTFEPGQVVGTRNTGTLVTSGIIASGVRKLCYSFLTRNGFITQPSPIATVDITTGASGIVVSNLLTGPSNVIARIIHLTAANGGNFYNIPKPVTVIDNGQNVVNTSTWVNDNTSTSATLSFSDGVLLAADQIDIQGNNRFECFELGSCVAIIPYAERLAIIGEQNKVFNFLNMSFDGGIAGGSGSTQYPAGWTVVGAGQAMTTSPLFGFAYQIINASGSLQAIYGMITQPAFQDEFEVPIIAASTTYSVRVTAGCPTGSSGGNLVVDLFSPSSGLVLGSRAIPLASMLTTQNIDIGPMLTTTLAPVPADLLLRVYATNIPNGVTVTIDRIEPFPTEAPNLNTQMILSYQGDFESFDRLTGVILCTQQNQQPVLSAFTLFGTLYPVKTGSILGINENQSTEPAYWNKPRMISNAVGTVGPYAVTAGIDEQSAGEEWALIGGIAGLFIFNGAQPVKLSEEIQSLWNQIFWTSKHKMWIKNDVKNRRILIGCPMVAPNTWLPAGKGVASDSTPTDANVIIELNYKQLNTAGALMESVLIHRSYSGKLLASDIVRKWSIWTIKAPCAAFVARANSTEPLFLGNSDDNAKVFTLIDGLMEDDGLAIDQLYVTAGFVPSEVGEGRQMGVVRYYYGVMTLGIDGTGSLSMTAYPDKLTTQYPAQLLPNLDLPLPIAGDAEIPVDQTGNRLFMFFETNAVGASFSLFRVVMVMRSDPWASVRGRNN